MAGIRPLPILLKSNVNSFIVQVLFQFWYGNLAEMEHAGCQCGIGMSEGEGIAEVLFLSGTTAGNDGNGERVGQLSQCFAGISGLFQSGTG